LTPRNPGSMTCTGASGRDRIHLTRCPIRRLRHPKTHVVIGTTRMTHALLGWDPVEVKLWLPSEAGIVAIRRDSCPWKEAAAGQKELSNRISSAPCMDNRECLRWMRLADHDVRDHLARSIVVHGNLQAAT